MPNKSSTITNNQNQQKQTINIKQTQQANTKAPATEPATNTNKQSNPKLNQNKHNRITKTTAINQHTTTLINDKHKVNLTTTKTAKQSKFTIPQSIKQNNKQSS